MPIADDLGLVLDAELAFGLDLGGQPVGVPAEAALDPVAAHGLVARNDVLDVAGEQVPVVRQAVGERRAVVEDVLVGAVRRRPGARRWTPGRCVLGPVGQDAALQRRESRGARSPRRRRPADTGARRRVVCRAGGGAFTPYSSSLQSSYLQGRDAIGVDRVPRYHPACPASGVSARPIRATLVPAVTGRTRSVLVRTDRAVRRWSRSSEWLAGDGRVVASVLSSGVLKR